MNTTELKQKLKRTLVTGFRLGKGLLTGFLAEKPGRPVDDLAATTGPKLHCRKLSGSHIQGAKSAGLPTRLLLWLLGGSAIAVLASTVTNVVGFQVIFPSSPIMAFLAGTGLETLVITTWLLLAKGSRAGRPWLKKAAALFATASVIFSVAGMLIGAHISQTHQDAGIKRLEAAHHAVQSQAEAATQVKQVYEGRVVNELQYMAKSTAPLTDLDSNNRFALAQISRKNDLEALRDRWRSFTYADMSDAQSPYLIWHALQAHYAIMQDLVAETRKGTSGPDCTLPPYPQSPVEGADAVDSGASDVTGMALFKPSPQLLLFLIVALAWELGPMLLARSINPEANINDTDEEPEAADPETKTGMAQDDLAERCESLVAATSDPDLAMVIARSHAACAAAEAVSLENMALKTAFKIGAERMDIIHDGADATRMTQPQYESLAVTAFERLLKQIEQDRELIDAERELRLLVGHDEIMLKRRMHERDVASQIAGLDAEIAGLGAAPDDPGQARIDAEREWEDKGKEKAHAA